MIVILMVVTAYLASHTFIATIVWTSRAYTGVINEALFGIVLAIAGLMGGVSGLLFGLIVKIKGPAVTIFIGLVSLFAGLILLIAQGDITSSDVLFFVTIGLILVSVAGGILLPSILYFSQAISKEGRGALAGLTTAGQFIGIALIPTTYETFYLEGGINAVYLAIFIISIFLTIIIGLLFRLAYRVIRFHDI
jgi:MFS family permease